MMKKIISLLTAISMMCSMLMAFNVNTRADENETLENITEPVAQVNNTKYQTLEDAIAAAEDGGTINIIKDIETEKVVAVPENKNIILNLNEKTLTSASKANAVNVNIGASLVIKNGNINAVSAVRILNNLGKATVENVVMTGGTQYAVVNNNNSEILLKGTTINGLTANYAVVNAGKAIIDGGTYTANTGALAKNGSAYEYSVVSGSFSSEITNETWLSELSLQSYNSETGKYDVALSEAVAKIGDVGYASLSRAIKTVPADNTAVTIDMLKDLTLEKGLILSVNQNITLNIGTHKITADYPHDYKSFIQSDANLTINAEGEGGIYAPKTYAISVWKGSFTMNGGTVEGILPISGNATIGYGNTTMNINGVTIKGDDTGIFHPQVGTLRVTDCNITAKTGIEMRAGTLEVNGGTIEATGEFSAVASSDGTTVYGAGIAVSQHVTNNPIDVTIKSGTIKGAKALYEADLQDETDRDKISISIINGTFDGEITVEDEIKTPKFITGGTFSSDVNEYAANGYKAVDYGDGKFRIEEQTPVAKIGDIKYYTLQEAVDAAEAGATVEVIAGTEEEVIVPLKNLTIKGDKTAVLTGGMKFKGDGTDVNTTIDGLKFDSKGIFVDHTQGNKFNSLTVTNSEFNNVRVEGQHTYAIMIANSQAIKNLTVTNNKFDGNASGCIYAVAGGTTTITGNEFNNSYYNILWLCGKNKGDVKVNVNNNVFNGWGEDPVNKGRAIRLDTFEEGAVVDLSENIFKSEQVPEEFVKFTGASEEAEIILDKNYWGGDHEPTYGEGEGLNILIMPSTTKALTYYADEEMKELKCSSYRHTLDDAKVTIEAKAPTCTEDGLTEGIKCKYCDEIIKAQEKIESTGHTEVVDEAVAATCTAAGKTEGSHCSVCDTVIKAPEEIPALEHKWNDGEITKEPTYTEKGEKTFTCTVCQATKTEEIELLPSPIPNKTAVIAVVIGDTEYTDTLPQSGEITAVKLHRENKDNLDGCTVYTAIYKDGKLAGITLAKITEFLEKDKTITITSPLGIGEAWELKVFVWDGLMKPMADMLYIKR